MKTVAIIFGATIPILVLLTLSLGQHVPQSSTTGLQVKPPREVPSSPAAPVSKSSSAQAMQQTGITREEDALIAPYQPGAISVEATAGGIVVSWIGTGEDDVVRYEILRQSGNGGDAQQWQLLGTVDSRAANLGKYEWIDVTARGELYRYGVRAVNIYGTKSSISASSQPVNRQ
jgi:hypothetical protein